MSIPILRAGIFWLAVALGLLSGAAFADEPAQTTDAVFGERVLVEVIEVEVFVSDRQGRAVTDLAAEDFEIFEDGRPVELTNFRRAVAGGGVSRQAAEPAPDAAPRLPSVRFPAPSPEVPLYLVLYVDNANLRAGNRRRVLRDLRELVQGQGGAAERIMVVSHERSLQVRQGLTSSRRSVIEALLAVEDEQVFGDGAHGELLELIRTIEDRNARLSWIEARVRGYAEERKQDVVRSLDALRKLVDSLAGLRGRKALVYAADSLSLNPAEELYQALEKRSGDLTVLHQAIQYDASRDFQRLAAAANTAKVAFYTLHAAGLEVPMAASAEVAGSGFDELRSTVDSVRTANLQGSGRLLAGETGGLALLNRNDFSAGLEQVVADFSTYYSLGYRAPKPGDGRYHKIEVKARRKGLKIRHRRGYRDRPLTDRMADTVRAGLHFGVAENPMGIEVAVGKGEDTASTPEDRGRHVVAVKVSIPLDQVVLVPRGETHEGRVRIFLSVRDQDGRESPVQEVEVPLRIPADRLQAALDQSWVQEVALRVRSGPQILAVGLWDELGHGASLARHHFEVED